MSHIVFLTVYLGLVSGLQPVQVRVDDAVKSVHVLLNGKDVATLKGAPWATNVDFGPTIDPGEVVAVAYDAQGEELARVSQIVNLPRPIAEAQLVLREEDGLPSAIEIIPHHLQFAQPSRVTVRIDDSNPKVSGLLVRLPKLDWTRSHVVSVELRFEDGALARADIVLNGGFSDSIGSQLSPVLLPNGDDRCIKTSPKPLRISAVDKPQGIVLFVLDPDPAVAVKKFAIWHRLDHGPIWDQLRAATTLPRDVVTEVMWPITKEFSSNRAKAILFDHTDLIDVSKHGLLWLLTTRMSPPAPESVPRQFTDAVAVAGVDAIKAAHRRAVVLVLTDTRDQSIHSIAVARHYLEAIHVPLFVWSLSGPAADVASDWGAVEDISLPDKLRAATETLRTALDRQKIAWVSADPLTAVRVEERCAK